jgi:hypothetical protein
MAYERRVTNVMPRAAGRETPDYRKVDPDAVSKHKSLAWRSWRVCRESGPLPPAWADALWVNALEAVAHAEQPAVRAKLLRRTEVVFKLLCDMQRWQRS